MLVFGWGGRVLAALALVSDKVLLGSQGSQARPGRCSPAEFTRPPFVSAGARPGDQELAVWTLAGAAETGREGGGGWRSWGP